MRYDIVIVGAGPVGLAFAASLANTKLNILLVEKSSLDNLRDPLADGREIALTHLSVDLMKNLGAWQHLTDEVIAKIKHARVVNGRSNYALNFNHNTSSVNVLGYLVPNNQIRQALFETIRQQDNVTLMNEVVATEVYSTQSLAFVTLSTGETINTALLVAADSRFSETRRNMGIAADIHDFSRTAIVCRMQHENSHNNTAVECFHYGRTLAILPMNGCLSSIVITVSSDQATQILNMNESQFNTDIQNQLNNQLGLMKLVGKRYPYPLVSVHANRFVTQRFALIGDAAVGMHPVTAQGFNLGLRSAHGLAKEIKSALIAGRDFTSRAVLGKYEAKHMLQTRPIYHGTNGIVSLFTNETLPAKILRTTAMRLANNLSPLKNIITRKLTEKYYCPV